MTDFLRPRRLCRTSCREARASTNVILDGQRRRLLLPQIAIPHSSSPGPTRTVRVPPLEPGCVYKLETRVVETRERRESEPVPRRSFVSRRQPRHKSLNDEEPTKVLVDKARRMFEATRQPKVYFEKLKEYDPMEEYRGTPLPPFVDC